MRGRKGRDSVDLQDFLGADSRWGQPAGRRIVSPRKALVLDTPPRHISGSKSPGKARRTGPLRRAPARTRTSLWQPLRAIGTRWAGPLQKAFSELYRGDSPTRLGSIPLCNSRLEQGKADEKSLQKMEKHHPPSDGENGAK